MKVDGSDPIATLALPPQEITVLLFSFVVVRNCPESHGTYVRSWEANNRAEAVERARAAGWIVLMTA